MAVDDYLKVIRQLRDLLKENLKAKNIFVDNKETFNELIPLVANIQTTVKTGAQKGVWTPTITTESFSLSQLPFIPAKLAISCDDVLTKSLSSIQDYANIGLLNIELTKKEIDILKQNVNNGVTVDTSGISADISIEEIDGLYNVTVSFEETNKSLDVKYKFKANASHVWCVADEGWLI